MYKIYFKQAIQILRQNPFMSIIAITGTALAIMMIMTMIVTEEVKNIPVTPEIHRNRTLYLHFQLEKDTSNSSRVTGSIPLKTYKEYLSELKTPEITTAVSSSWGVNYYQINRPHSKEYVSCIIKATDPGFWKIYSFNFIEGHPFSQEAFLSGIKEAVISESLARKLFKGESALGQTFELYQMSHRVVGVVKDISGVFTLSSSDIWVPYTSDDMWSGGVQVVMLMRSKADYPALVEEIQTAQRKYFADRKDWTIAFNDPVSHREYLRDAKGNNAEEISKNLRNLRIKRMFILCILLMVPAINLAGLSSSRIRKRMEEIGIRKAFGAKRHVIIMQVLFENLITSIIGGIIGLLLSYIVIFNMRQWLLNIPADHTIPLNTLISFPVILSICLLCIILNLLSAGIPAWKAARTTIIQSINQNNNTYDKTYI